MIFKVEHLKTVDQILLSQEYLFIKKLNLKIKVSITK